MCCTQPSPPPSIIIIKRWRFTNDRVNFENLFSDDAFNYGGRFEYLMALSSRSRSFILLRISDGKVKQKFVSYSINAYKLNTHFLFSETIAVFRILL